MFIIEQMLGQFWAQLLAILVHFSVLGTKSGVGPGFEHIFVQYILPRNQTYAVAAVPTVTGSIFLHAEIQNIFGTVYVSKQVSK